VLLLAVVTRVTGLARLGSIFIRRVVICRKVDTNFAPAPVVLLDPLLAPAEVVRIERKVAVEARVNVDLPGGPWCGVVL
jgi:uncharacterized membrane protein